MASTKATTSTGRGRGSHSKRGGAAGDESAVSSARWLGVALVITALLGAIILAVISPSEPGSGSRTGVGATGPTPEPTPEPTSIQVDVRIPTAQPEVISPKDGFTTGERTFKVTVTVPEHELPRNAVQLEVYRNGELVSTTRKPPADDVDVGFIRLKEGANEITAALTSSSGAGPLSEPIVINVDKVWPDVNVISPKENDRIFSKSTTVKGTTEVGAKVTVRNAANDRERTETVGPSGKFEIPILLDEGNNRIIVVVVDDTDNQAPRVVRRVTRATPKPKVALRLSVNEIKVSSLPKTLAVTAIVNDSNGKPIEGAEVIFHLSVSDQGARTESDVTDERGQARWRTVIERSGARRGEGFVTVEVKTNGATGQQTKALTLK